MNVDPNGQRVLAFTGKIENLARVAELTDSVVEIAKSGAWRDYQTAVGHENWREAELDYFLIACGLHYDDVSRILAWNKDATELAPMMDRSANSTKRRPLEEAATTWHSPTGETFPERARRLGWLGERDRFKSPVPERARAKAKHNVTMDEHARHQRAQRIPAERRRELDERAEQIRAEVLDIDERRYLIERLADDRGGRPSTSTEEFTTWQTDAEELDWDTRALAERWGIARRSAQQRVKRLREMQS